MSYIVSYYFTKNNGHATGFGHAKYPEYLGFESLLKNIRCKQLPPKGRSFEENLS